MIRRAILAACLLLLVVAPSHAGRDFVAASSEWLGSSAPAYHTQPYWIHSLARSHGSGNTLYSTGAGGSNGSGQLLITVAYAQDAGKFVAGTTTVTNILGHQTSAIISSTSRIVWTNGADEQEDTATESPPDYSGGDSRIGERSRLTGGLHYDGECYWVAVFAGTPTVSEALELHNGRDPRTMTGFVLKSFWRLRGRDPEPDRIGGIDMAVQVGTTFVEDKPCGW